MTANAVGKRVQKDEPTGHRPGRFLYVYPKCGGKKGKTAQGTREGELLKLGPTKKRRWPKAKNLFESA